MRDVNQPTFVEKLDRQRKVIHSLIFKNNLIQFEGIIITYSKLQSSFSKGF
jgi:hypothetical protein